MTITKQQKSIVNPGAKSLNSVNRSGELYNYESERSRWIIEGIHDSYLSFGDFPSAGLILDGVTFGEEGDTILATDLLAYAALYPQNAIYNPEKRQLEMVSGKASLIQLERVISSLLQNAGTNVTNYLSVTTPESLLPQNQEFVDKTVEQSLAISRERFINQTTSQLIAIPQRENDQRLLDIRRSFGNPSYSIIEDSFGIIEENNLVPNSPEQGNIDIYDWRRNVELATTRESLYYNPNDFRLYCVKKVKSSNPSLYDVSSDNYDNKKNQARQTGIEEILRFSQKYTVQNVQDLLSLTDLQDNMVVQFESYLDPRPSSQWIYAVYIDKKIIDDLPYVGEPNKGIQNISNYKKSARLSSDQTNQQSRRVVYEVSKIKDTLEDVSKTLRTYHSIMSSEGVDLSMISNIRLLDHANRLENFYNSLSSFLDYNDVIMNPDTDIAELVFDDDMHLLYIVYNGYVYADGIASRIFFSSNSPQNSNYLSVDFFSDLPPQTMSYIFNGNKISQKYSDKPKAGWDPWTKFLQSYSYPPFETYASKLSKNPQSDINNFPVLRADKQSIFVTLDKALGDSRYVDTSTPKITRKEFFNEVNQAMGSCGTAQARLLGDIFELVQLLNSKKDVKKIIRFTVSQLKERLILDELSKERIALAEQYALNPLLEQDFSTIQRDIERRINAELACIVDVLGGRLEDQILSPLGVPPNTSRMLRQAATAPLGVDFWSTRPKNSSPWALWRKAIKKIFEAYLKKLLLGVLRDILEASLGCGPYSDKQNEGLADPTRSRTYGLANLNAVIDYAELDILPIAKNLGMINKFAIYEQDPNNNRLEIRTLRYQDATIEQLRQFNEDVSKIVTPQEMQLLLEGSAGFQLINVINQMVNHGRVNERLLRDQISGDTARLDPINIQRYQESLEAGDTRYASLGIGDDIIQEYFSEIGNQLGPFITPMIERGSRDVTPYDAYCLRNKPFPPSVMNPGVSYPSPEQVTKQYTSAIEAKKNQIESLCGLLDKNLPNIQFKIDGFLDNLPNSEFYNQLLDLIAWLSNFISDSLTKSLYGDDDNVSSEKTKPASFSDTPFGKSLVQSIPSAYITSFPATQKGNTQIVGAVTPNSTPAGKFYVTPTRNLANNFSQETSLTPAADFSASDKTHRVYGTIYDNTGKIFIMDPDGEFYEGASIELAETNTIFRNNSFSLRGLKNTNGDIANENLPPFPAEASGKFLTVGGVNQSSIRLNSYRKVIANQSDSSFTAISNFYFTDVARRKLTPYLEALGKYKFDQNLDNCITVQDITTANSAIDGISSRLIPFFINIGPLMRLYFGWNTPDIINLLTDYFLKKFQKQTREKAIYGIYLDSLEVIQKVYGLEKNLEPRWIYSPTLDRDKFYIDDTMNPEEKLRSVIRTLILANLKNIGQTAYENVNTNVFDLESSYNWFTGTSQLWYAATDTPFPNLASVANQDQLAYMENMTREEQYSNFLGYFPLPVMVSMDIIFFDSCIKLVENYHRWHYDTNRRIFSADDSLLSSVNNNYVFTPQATFDPFPVNLQDPLTDVNTTFYSRAGLRNELGRLNQILIDSERGTPFVNWFTEDYLPAQQQIRSSTQSLLEKLNEIYNTFDADDFQNGRIEGTRVDDAISLIVNSEGVKNNIEDKLVTYFRRKTIRSGNQRDNETWLRQQTPSGGLSDIFNSDQEFTLNQQEFIDDSLNKTFSINRLYYHQIYQTKISYGTPASPSDGSDFLESLEDWRTAVKVTPLEYGMTEAQVRNAGRLNQAIGRLVDEAIEIFGQVNSTMTRLELQMHQAFKSADGIPIDDDIQALIVENNAQIDWSDLFVGTLLNQGEVLGGSVYDYLGPGSTPTGEPGEQRDDASPSGIYRKFFEAPGKVNKSIEIITDVLSQF